MQAALNRLALGLCVTLALGCGEPTQVAVVAPPQPASCGGPPLTVTFYDVGQGLGALVTLPDGRRILVDTGVLPSWPACAPCRTWSRRFLDALAADVPDHTLDTIWITHQHADHNGNADTIMNAYTVKRFVDNGSDGHTPGQHKRATRLRELAAERGIEHWVAAPERPQSPWPPNDDVTITPVVPSAWPVPCSQHDGVNNCSIGLRVDYCQSSVLFTGDAEQLEEEVLPVSPVTLLQVGHHGSRTSSSTPFLDRTRPQLAVISAAPKDEGTNRGYCHPSADTVARLNRALAPQRSATMWAFGGARCKDPQPNDWAEVPVSDGLFATARDGHLRFVTDGSGTFDRVHD